MNPTTSLPALISEFGKKIMNFKQVTPEEIIENDAKNYNPSEWRYAVTRYLKFKNVRFFIETSGQKYGNDVFYVVYETQDGIRFIKEISYISSLTSTGFCFLRIDEKGDVYQHLIDLEGSLIRVPNHEDVRPFLKRTCENSDLIVSNQ